MTTEGEEEIDHLLQRWVIQDSRPVTARLLAVKQGVHIQTARACMQRFLDTLASKGQAAPHAQWIVTGSLADDGKVKAEDSQASSLTLADGNVDETASVTRQAVLLVGDRQLTETKSRFASDPQVTLYAISPPLPENDTVAHRAAASSQLTTIQHDLKNTPEYVKKWEESEWGTKLGLVRPADDIKSVRRNGAAPAGLVTDPPKKAAGSGIASATNAKPAATTKAKAATLSFDGAKKTKKDAEPAEKAKTEKAPKKPDAMEVDEEDDDNDDGPIGYGDDDDEKGESDKKAKKGATDIKTKASKAKRADAGDKASSAEEKRRRQKQELMDMMDEDRDGHADPDVKEGASTSKSMMGSKAGDAGEPAKKEKQRVRKQRKVIRKETTKNAQGYRVTRDVEGYESYSSFESSEEEADDKKKPKKAAARSKAAGQKQANKADGEEGKAAAEESQDTTATQPPQPEKKEDPKPTPAPSKNAKPAAKKPTSTGSGQQKLSSFFTRKG